MNLHAQTKVAYLNLEAVIALMPETQTINKELGALEQRLAEKLQITQQYAQSKVTEAQELAALPEPPQDRLQQLQQEIQKLQQELYAGQQKAQQELGMARNQKMGPVLDKIQKALDEMADEKGYTYVLNASSNGTSLVLKGIPGDDLTEPLLTKLGVEIPDGLKSSE